MALVDTGFTQGVRVRLNYNANNGRVSNVQVDNQLGLSAYIEARLTDGRTFGTVPNPIAPGRIAGGSSGGCGAALAAGLGLERPVLVSAGASALLAGVLAGGTGNVLLFRRARAVEWLLYMGRGIEPPPHPMFDDADASSPTDGGGDGAPGDWEKVLAPASCRCSDGRVAELG
mgnify:CR=1 FL=1